MTGYCRMRKLTQLRGREIAFVPQSVKSLDPLMKVGKQIGGDAHRRQELFERYGLSPEVEDLYPFELQEVWLVAYCFARH